MSSGDSSDAQKTLVATFAERMKHEHFLHLLMLVLIGCIMWLSYVGKQEIIPSLIEVGSYSIGVTLFGVFAKWLGSRLEAVIDSMPRMADVTGQLAREQTDIRRSVGDLAIGVGTIASDLHQNRSVVLLIEDNPIDSRILTSACVEILQRFRVSLRVVSTLKDAMTFVHRAAVTIVDVSLPDNDSAERINNLISVAAPWPVIINSRTKYHQNDFPGAVAVIDKEQQVSELVTIIGDCLAKTRF